MAGKNYFEELNAIDLSQKIKTKNGLTFVSWSSAWATIKTKHPEATFDVHEQIIDEYGNTRYWFDDGKTGWVKVTVTMDDKDGKSMSVTERLAIMDFKNKSIPADQITSADANKAMKRCLVKACALHGLGLYIYEGEDLPDEVSKVAELQQECMELIRKKCELSDKAKNQVGEICKAADPAANGDPRLIEDADVLAELKKQLLAVRK